MLSQDIGCHVSEFRAFALLTLDLSGHRYRAEPADNVIESVGGRVHIRIINLVRITSENDFGPMAGPGDDGLGLQWCEVLALANNHELIGDAAAANITQGFDDDAAGAHE